MTATAPHHVKKGVVCTTVVVTLTHERLVNSLSAALLVRLLSLLEGQSGTLNLYTSEPFSAISFTTPKTQL